MAATKLVLTVTSCADRPRERRARSTSTRSALPCTASCPRCARVRVHCEHRLSIPLLRLVPIRAAPAQATAARACTVQYPVLGISSHGTTKAMAMAMTCPTVLTVACVCSCLLIMTCRIDGTCTLMISDSCWSWNASVHAHATYFAAAPLP